MIIIYIFLSVILATTDGSPTIQLREQKMSEIEMISQELEQILPGLKSPERHVGNILIEQKSIDMEMKIPHGENITNTDKKQNQSLDSPSEENRAMLEQATGQDLKLRELNLDLNYVFYQNANGSLKLHRTPATWTDARLICYDEGAELASPENEALLTAMSKVLLTSRQPPLYVFTGVNDLYSKGFFSSLRGTSLAAMPARWAPEEPDNVNNGDNCLILQRNGLLLDGKCDDVYPYICYKRQPAQHVNFCGTTDIDYVFDTSTKSCYKFHTEATTWHEAYATCSREAGHLAVVNSDTEAKVLSRLFPKDWTVAAIGFSYWREDLWVTIHGQTLSEAGYDIWGKDEPNDWQGQRCGAIYADGTLDDIGCLRSSGYICEKKSIWI